MKNIIKEIESELNSNRNGDYINIPGSTNQIVDINVFNKSEYTEFINSPDEWVDGGFMVELKDVKDSDIVIAYYGKADVEYSFVVGEPNQDSQEIALNKAAVKVMEN